MLVVASLPKTPEVDLSIFNPRTALGVDVESSSREQVLKVRDRYLSDEELAIAMKTIVLHSFGITPDDLFIVTAREFGFKRTGENITYSLRKVYQQMLKNGEITEVDGKVHIS